MRASVRLTVVVATYNSPAALDAVLHGLWGQSDPGFDVVIADDGSGPETAAAVERWRELFAEIHRWSAARWFLQARGDTDGLRQLTTRDRSPRSPRSRSPDGRPRAPACA